MLRQLLAVYTNDVNCVTSALLSLFWLYGGVKVPPSHIRPTSGRRRPDSADIGPKSARYDILIGIYIHATEVQRYRQLIADIEARNMDVKYFPVEFGFHGYNPVDNEDEWSLSSNV